MLSYVMLCYVMLCWYGDWTTISQTMSSNNTSISKLPLTFTPLARYYFERTRWFSRKYSWWNCSQIHMYMYVCIYIYIHTYIYIYIYIDIDMDINTVCVWYICIYYNVIHMCVCMCVYIYIYIYIPMTIWAMLCYATSRCAQASDLTENEARR